MTRRPLAILLLGLLAAPLHAQVPDTAPNHKPDPVAVQRFGPAYRYPQAGWVVLHIEGEPYARGYQHGRLLAPEIAAHVRALAAQAGPKAPAESWRHVRTLANAVFLRKFDREYLEEMKGIADGAADAGAAFEGRRIDLVDIVAVNVWLELDTLPPALNVTPTGLEKLKLTKPEPMMPANPAPAAPPPVKPDHCSAFAATGPATADGKIVFGHITMFGLMSAPFVNVWIDVAPKDGSRVVMQAFPGGIWSSQDYYMNGAGILLAETTINQTPFDIDGVPLASRARKAIQYAKTIDDVVRYLSEKNNGLYTNEWLIGDTKTQEIALFELGTKNVKLWRSGKDDWFGGTKGFYGGCNNAKDSAVRQEAMSPNRPGRGADWSPEGRDNAWQREFKTGAGKIDAAWGKKVFSNPALALGSSLDAKVTTSNMADKLESIALYGNPTGRVWRPSPRDTERFPEIKPLVPHPWTVLSCDPPPSAVAGSSPADLTTQVPPALTMAQRLSPDAGPAPSPAWTGKPDAHGDADFWLTAGLAAYAPIAGLEASLSAKTGGTLSPADTKRIEVALYPYRSMWLSARAAAPQWRTNGKPTDQELEKDRPRWVREQTGYGVVVLAELRRFVGPKAFDEAVAAFTKTNDGKAVTLGAFLSHLDMATGKDPTGVLKDLKRPAPTATAYSTQSFADELDRCVIVFGTLDDEAANRGTANDLRDRIARRDGAKLTVLADKDAQGEAIAEKHLILVGRPSTNRVTAALAKTVPVEFRSGALTVGSEVFAHPDTLVVAAGPNPKNPRYNVTVVAGLSGAATYLGSEALAGRAAVGEVVIYPAAGRARPLVLSAGG
ncbi:MAG TPA: C45 family peptidase [Gemmataceae bacterium]|nr:C45 family peptidase [Gemmataceae bacterium]